MAEQEVIKHTKKIFSAWGSQNSGFWHKLREFTLEVIIIVFAVSLSIYLHERSQKKHQHHETKEFLYGLRMDLELDMKEMEDDKEAFRYSKAAGSYLVNRKMNEPLHPDSLKIHYSWLINNTGLIPNSGRFEGFKSAGKIGSIENKELQNNIMDLYQENIPGLIMSTDGYATRKQKLLDFIYQNRKRVTDSTTNIRLILAGDQSYNIATTLIGIEEILRRYDLCIDKMKAIIKQIDEEYGK